MWLQGHDPRLRLELCGGAADLVTTDGADDAQILRDDEVGLDRCKHVLAEVV